MNRVRRRRATRDTGETVNNHTTASSEKVKGHALPFYLEVTVCLLPEALFLDK